MLIVEQKTYAQIVIIDKEDFIFSSEYGQYETMCPFMCFPGICAASFRTSVKEPEKIVPNKDVILLLAPYWKRLTPDEKKAILDHELGHISKGHLKLAAEKLAKGHTGASPVDETEEKEADAYSSEMNGKPAMYNGLLQALNLMVDGYRAKGYRITTDFVLSKDPILRNRLAVLSAE